MPIHTDKCPLCGGRFAEGVLVDRGHYSAPKGAEWHDSVPMRGFLGALKFKRGNLRTVTGYRCQECGYLMLFAADAR
jgi:hypothetical protein